MKRRIAAPEERCERMVTRYARWKAQRSGREPENQCSFRRVPGSQFCRVHQPDFIPISPHARRLSDAQARDVYRRYWEPRRRIGLLPGEKPDPDEPGGPFPSMAALAAEYGVSMMVAWNILHERTYRRPADWRIQRRRQALAVYHATGSLDTAARTAGLSRSRASAFLRDAIAQKRHARRRRHMALRVWLACGLPITDVANRAGVSRRTAYEVRKTSAAWIQRATIKPGGRITNTRRMLERRRMTEGLLLAGGSE